MRKNISLTDDELQRLRDLRALMLREGAVPSVRAVARHLGYKYPRSVTYLYEKLEKKGALRMAEGKVAYLADVAPSQAGATTVPVPLLGPAGASGQTTMQVSTRLAQPPHDYFLLRAPDGAMHDAGINAGDLVLARRQAAARHGDTVVAWVDGALLVRHYRPAGDTALLQPCSHNRNFKDIILPADFSIQGVVVAAIPRDTKKGPAS